jgi:hypothetical protein
MTEANRIAALKTPFHPASHYDSPGDVLRDAKLSAAEKRIILSSWASDMYAVESDPSLRDVPGVPNRMRLNDILSTLRQLDNEFDPPPRGGAAMRVWRPVSLDAVARATTATKDHSARRRSWVAARR